MRIYGSGFIENGSAVSVLEAPVPEDAVSRVKAPLIGYASLKQNILHDFQSI